MARQLYSETRRPDAAGETQHSSQVIRRYRHAKWRSALQNFSPMWFSLCISSGGLGLVLNAPFPYPARWLSICGDIFFVIDLVTFLLFLAVMVARWIVFPRLVLRKLVSDQQELAAYAIIPITLHTIAALVASQVSTANWGGTGNAFMLVSYVLWWIGMVLNFVHAAAVIIILSRSPEHIGRIMSPAVFLPIVGMATAAVEAGTISEHSSAMSTRLVIPMLIMGYFLLGIAIWMGLVLYALFLYRLMNYGWPEGPGIASLALLVSPATQTASGLQILGQVAGQDGRFAQYARGTFFTQQMGQMFQGAGTLLSLLFIGLGIFWFMIAIFVVIDIGFVKRKAVYNLTWWAVVFPVVTLDTALLQLGTSMDSPAFRVLATALFIFLFIAYLINWVFTVWSVFKGDLLFGPSQLDKDGNVQDYEDIYNNTGNSHRSHA